MKCLIAVFECAVEECTRKRLRKCHVHARMTNLNGILNILHILYLSPQICPNTASMSTRESRLLGDVMNVINAMML